MKNITLSLIESNIKIAASSKTFEDENCYCKRLLGLEHGDHQSWMDNKLLPNTRLLVEPKIEGSAMVLTYEKGHLKYAINKKGRNKTFQISQIQNVPQKIPILSTIRIQGVVYSPFSHSKNSGKYVLGRLNQHSHSHKDIAFAGFQIFNVDLNQHTQLKALSKLGFEIPPNEYTRRCVREVEIYIRLWKEKKIFYEVPNKGLVLKVNSRKFQKALGESQYYPYWAYSINS